MKSLNLSNILLCKFENCKKQQNIIFFTIICILIIIAGFRPIGIDNDSVAYNEAIKVFINDNFSKLDFSYFEPSFHIIAYLSFLLSNTLPIDTVRLVLIIYASLAIPIKIYVIKKEAAYPIFSLYVYLTLYFFLQEFTQIRAAVATSIFLLALPDIINKRYFHYIYKILIATFFHYSSLLALLLIFVNTKKFNNKLYMILPIAGIIIAFIPQQYMTYAVKTFVSVVNIPIISDKFYSSFTSKIILLDPIEIILKRKLWLSILCIYYIILYIKIKNILNIDGFDILCLKIIGISLFFGFSFAFSKNISLRVPEFFLVILVLFFPRLPLLFDKFISKKIITSCIVIYCFIVLVVDYMVIRNLVHWGILLKCFH